MRDRPVPVTDGLCAGRRGLFRRRRSHPRQGAPGAREDARTAPSRSRSRVTAWCFVGRRRHAKHILSALPAGDFPPMPSPDETAPRLELKAGVLAGLIEQVVDAVSTDETRAHLNSALFEWEGETVRMVSTDGHRLHKAEAKVEGNAGLRTLLIPLRALVEPGSSATRRRRWCSRRWSRRRFRDARPHVLDEDGGRAVPAVRAGDSEDVEARDPVSAAALAESIRAVLVSASAKTGGSSSSSPATRSRSRRSPGTARRASRRTRWRWTRSGGEAAGDRLQREVPARRDEGCDRGTRA